MEDDFKDRKEKKKEKIKEGGSEKERVGWVRYKWLLPHFSSVLSRRRKRRGKRSKASERGEMENVRSRPWLSRRFHQYNCPIVRTRAEIVQETHTHTHSVAVMGFIKLWVNSLIDVFVCLLKPQPSSQPQQKTLERLLWMIALIKFTRVHEIL